MKTVTKTSFPGGRCASVMCQETIVHHLSTTRESGEASYNQKLDTRPVGRLTRVVLVFFLVQLCAQLSWAQTTRYWVGGATAAFNVASSWSGSVGGAGGASAPVPGDYLIFDGTDISSTGGLQTGTVTVTGVPTLAVGRLLLQNNATVVLQGGGTTLSVSNGALNPDFQIGSGSSLTIGTNLNFTLSSPASATIDGALSVNASRTFTIGGPLSLNGTLTNSGTIIVSGTGTLSNAGSFTAGTLIFQGGSTYVHAQNGGAIPTATWNANSNCNVTGITNTALAAIPATTFANFTWDCPGQTIPVSLVNATVTLTVSGNFYVASTNGQELRICSANANPTLQVNGNFTVGNGTNTAICNLHSRNGNTTTLSIGGNIAVNTNGTLTKTGNTTITVTLGVGTATQVVSWGGAGTYTNTYISYTIANVPAGKTVNLLSGISIPASQTLTVNSGATLNCGTNVVSGAGTFTLNAGASLATANTAGITTSPTASGSIQTTTRTFNTGANYTYNGSTNQATGSGLPTTVNNLTVANTGTSPNNVVTLSGNCTVSANLTTTSGSLAVGSNTLTLNGASSSGSSVVTTASSGLTFGGSTAGVNIPSSVGQLSNLTINNTNGVTMNSSITLSGNPALTLTSGILYANANALRVTNTATAAVSTTAASYVSGGTFSRVLNSGGTNIYFPVGNSTCGGKKQFTLNNPVVGAGSELKVSYSCTGTGSPDNLTLSSLPFAYNWKLELVSGSFTSTDIKVESADITASHTIGFSSTQGGVYGMLPNATVATGSTTATGITALPKYFTPGISIIKTFYSYQSQSWSSPSAWTLDPSGTLWVNPTSLVPSSTDNVVILNGRTIMINENTKTVASLKINDGGVLDLNATTGHNFGTVSGEGKLKLASNTFPSGTFTSFMSTGGGIVEYYNLNNLMISSTQLTYNNLIISNYTSGNNTVFLDNASAGITYTINGNFQLQNNATGSLTFYYGNPVASSNLISMVVYGDYTVAAGCHVRVNNFAGSNNIPNPGIPGAPSNYGPTALSSYPVHTLTLYGNLTNNGSIRFTGLPSPVVNAYYRLTTTSSGGVNYGHVQVDFVGATNNTVTCNGITDFYRFIVEKGVDQTYTLEVVSSSVSNFGLYGPNYQGNYGFNGNPEGYGIGAYYKALFLHYGTLKLGDNITIPSLSEEGQDFNLIPTASLWVNGATVSTTVSGYNFTGYQAATLYGLLRISAGQFSTGDAAGIVLGDLGTPIIQIEGTGVLDVSQAWGATSGGNIISYIQSGGSANIRLQGEQHNGPMLGLSGTNTVFQMSGGTLNFTNNTFVNGVTDYQIMDIRAQAGNYQVTGGTVNLNLPSSATTYTANSTVPFYNVNVLNKTGTGTTTVTWSTPASSLTVLQDLTIGANATLSCGAVDVNIGRDFSINTGGTYIAGPTTTFNGSVSQAFNVNGSISGNLQKLTVANASKVTIRNNGVTMNGDLTIGANCQLDDNGYTVRVAGNIVNAGTHAGLLTNGGLLLNGTSAQVISGGGTFCNIIVDKPNTSGVSLGSDVSMTGNLRLVTNPNLTIGTYNLSLSAGSNIYTNLTTTAQAFDNTHMIVSSGQPSDGGVTKTFSSLNTSFVYPLGTGTYFRKASVTVNSATAYGSVTIRPVMNAHPLIQSATHAINLYWKTTSSSFTDANVSQVYYYNSGSPDVPNPPVVNEEASYIPASYQAPNWVWTSGNTGGVLDNVNPREIHFDNVDYIDGEYTCGTAAAFTGLAVYYSNSNNPNISTGVNWNSANAWCTGSHTGTPTTLPGTNFANMVFIIGDGSAMVHKINLSANNFQTGNIQIKSNGVLDIAATNGHNFGAMPNTRVSGTGTLRIASSAYFPRGDWGDFLGSTGGTVEYYLTASGTLTLPTSYQLPVSGSVNITSYYNLKTSPYNTSNIILPNTNLLVYNNFTVGYTVGGGTINCRTHLNSGGTTTTLQVVGTIQINQYGNLLYNGYAANVIQNIVADGDISIASGGSLSVNNGNNTVNNTLTVSGNIINNGVFDLYPGTRYCTLTFTGSSNKQFSGTTATMSRFYNVNVNKGVNRNSIIDVTVNNTGFSFGGTLTLNYGTFRLSTVTTIGLSTGAFTIPSTACLSANGGTLNIATATAAADLMLNGRLEVLNGAVNIGAPGMTNAHNIVYASAGTPEIVVSNAGSLYVLSQVRRSTAIESGSLSYSQSGTSTVTVGGIANATTRGVFEILNPGSSFTMSGGTLVIADAATSTATSPYDLDIEPETYSVTGGTVQLGLSGGTAAPNKLFYVQVSCPLYNLTLESSKNIAAIQQIYPLTLLGSLTIGGTSSYYNANSLDVTIGGNLVNNNTTAAANSVITGGYRVQATTQTTTFNGSSDQTISGTATPNRTNFGNLVVSLSPSRTLSLSGTVTSNIAVHGDLTISSGTLNDRANTIYLLGNVDNSATHTSTSPTQGGMSFIGPVNQVMSGSGSGVFGNIEINNAGKGVNMVDNSTFTSQLKLTDGYLYIDDYKLTLGQSATVVGSFDANKQIRLNGVVSDAGVVKLFSSNASGSFTFPVGVSGKYTPCTYTLPGTNTAGASIRVTPVNSVHPAINTTMHPNYLRYYWYVVSSGFTGVAGQSYTYVPADVTGTPTSVEKFDNTTYLWGSLAGGSISSPTFTTGNVSIDGEYTIGDVFTSLPMLYSIVSRGSINWNDNTAWSINPSGVPVYSGYPAGNPVVIQTGNTVSLVANGAVAHSIEVSSGAILDTKKTTFHSLGHVSGAGKVMLESTNDGMYVFPGGDLENFFANTSSTVEFYGSTNATLPLKPGNVYKPYRHVILSGTGIKYMSAENLKIMGNITISNGSSLSNILYNKNLYVLGNWIDANTSVAGFVPGTGRVEFMGATSQSLNMANNTMTEPFYNFTINNANGLTIAQGNANVNNKLYLTLGTISTSANNKLTINNTSTSAVVGGSINSFVNGPLRKQISNGSSFLFPVGDAVSQSRNRFGYISVMNTSTTGTQIWTTEFLDSNPTLSGYDVSSMDVPLGYVNNNEYWKVGCAAAGTANVQLSWDSYSGMSSQASARAKSRVAQWNTGISKWTSVGQTVSDGGQNSGTVATSSNVTLSSTQVFTLGATTMPVAQVTASSLSVCDDGVSKAWIKLSITGATTTFNYSYSIDGVLQTPVSAITSPDTLTFNKLNLGTTGSHIIKLENVWDANGDYGTILNPTQLTVVLNPVPSNTITGASTVSINSTNIAFSTTADANTYAWSFGPTTGLGTISGSSNAITVNWGAATGSTSLNVLKTITATGCNATAVLPISVVTAPAPNVTGRTYVCSGSSYTYTSGDNNPTYTYRWTVTGASSVLPAAALVGGAGITSITVTWGATGTGSVSVTETKPGPVSGSSTLSPVNIGHAIPSALLTNTVVSPTCQNTTTTITVNSAENLINYQLILSGVNNGAPLQGNGGNLVLTTGSLTTVGNNVFSIKAYAEAPFDSVCYITENLTATVNVTPSNSATLTSAVGTDNQMVCTNTPITSITYATTGATNISNNGVSGANGLPAGVSASWVGNTITISGTPTASGTYNYSIPLVGGCGVIAASGTIIVVKDFYSNGSDLSQLSNWGTNVDGSGTQPVSFNLSGALFHVGALQNVVVSNNWSLGSGVNLDIVGKVIPDAGVVISGAGSISGTGTLQVSILTGTADFASQYTISTIDLSTLTVEYISSTGAQNITGGLTYSTLKMSNTSGVNGMLGNITVTNLDNSSGGILDASTRTIAATTISNTGSTIRFSGASNGVAVSTGTVEYRGSNQNVQGGTYNNLVIAGSGVKTLTSSAIVNGQLTLSDGVVSTSTANMLTIATSGSVTGYSNLSYVEGPISHVVATAAPTTVVFPVGIYGMLHLAELTVTNADATATTYSGQYFFSNARTLHTLPLDQNLTYVSAIGYWNISKSNLIGVSATVKLYYNDAFDAVTDIPNLKIAKSTAASQWSNIGGSVAPSTGYGYITSDPFTSFSDFALANANGGTNPLPITLASFVAKTAGNDVLLHWVTMSENNNDYFVVEKSTDGSAFYPVVSLKGAGTSSVVSNYSYADKNAGTGVLYYRLKQVDFDGSFEYSHVVSVTVEVQKNASPALLLELYPIPGNLDAIVVTLGGGESSTLVVTVEDELGHQVCAKTMAVSGAYTQFNLGSLCSLRPGVYFMKVSNAREHLVKSFVVK